VAPKPVPFPSPRPGRPEGRLLLSPGLRGPLPAVAGACPRSVCGGERLLPAHAPAPGDGPGDQAGGRFARRTGFRAPDRSMETAVALGHWGQGPSGKAPAPFPLLEKPASPAKKIRSVMRGLRVPVEQPHYRTGSPGAQISPHRLGGYAEPFHGVIRSLPPLTLHRLRGRS
jgi:hypothetical protein